MSRLVAQTAFAPVKGGELHYESLGEGEAIVFIHAGVADHRMWDDQFYVFGIDHHVIRYDTRGFGKSRTESVEFSNRQDVIDLMDHLGVEKAHLIGCSRGGQIAVDTAVEFPDRVLSLVPTAAGLSGFDIEPTPELLAEWDLGESGEAMRQKGEHEQAADFESWYWTDGPRSPKGRAPSHVRAKVRQMILSNNTRHDGEGKAVPLDPPAFGRLGSISVSTLVVEGEFDELTEHYMAVAMENGISGARRIVLPAAHMIPMELPVEFNSAVSEFLVAR
jgi:3-oxoadipate enol-lactonase